MSELEWKRILLEKVKLKTLQYRKVSNEAAGRGLSPTFNPNLSVALIIPKSFLIFKAKDK